MKFEYQAIDGDGGVVRGIINAKNAEKVLQILLHKQLHPLDIRALTDSTVELSRLHYLKHRLEGKKQVKRKEKPESRVTLKEEMKKKEKAKIDWDYVLFLLIIISLLTAAALG